MKFGLDIPHNAANSFNLLFVLLISTIYSTVFRYFCLALLESGSNRHMQRAKKNVRRCR